MTFWSILGIDMQVLLRHHTSTCIFWGAAQLKGAAHFSPVITFNFHESQCDALILRDDCENPVLHVPLPRCTLARANKLRDAFRIALQSHGLRTRKAGRRTLDGGKDHFLPILRVLWDDLVKPIIEAMQLQVNSLAFLYVSRF